MNKYSLMFVSGLILSMSFAQAALFTFIEDETKHKLSIEKGSEVDFSHAKIFAIKFFAKSYNEIPQDQREFETVEELINQKFSDHYPRIFDKNQYAFFVVKDDDKLIGYTIFDVIDDVVYSIETQTDFMTYGIKSMMPALAQFIKKVYAPQATSFIQAARKAVPLYGKLLQICGSVPCNQLHPSLANPAEYYGEEGRKNVASYYQAYQLQLPDTDMNEMD